MDKITRLNGFIQRASKISETQSREAASLMLELYTDTNDSARLAEYIMKLKPTVCQFFFEKAVESMDLKQIEALHAAIRTTESYKKNANNAATTRGFIISAILIKNRFENARAILMQSLADFAKRGEYSNAVIELFKTYVISYCDGQDIVGILDERDWESPGLRSRFTRFIQMVQSSYVTVISTAKYDDKTVEKPKSPYTASSPVQNDMILNSGEKAKSYTPEADSAAFSLATELLRKLEASNREAQQLLNTLTESNGTIMMLREQLANRESRISQLNTELHERDRQIAGLFSDADREKSEKHEQQLKIADLTERLKQSMKIDGISQNHDLLSLKEEMSSRFKRIYADFLLDKDSDYNENTFEVFRNLLTRVFRVLQHYDIEVEEKRG